VPIRPEAPCPPSRGRDRGLIFGLIHMRLSTFIGIQINTAMQVTNVSVIRRTVIPSPENRKVSASTTAR
jgi:hypothetical protein